MKIDIGILQMSQDLAAHASSRQAVIAQNIANADTPGYKARDMVSFADSFRETANMRTSSQPLRAGHIAFGAGGVGGDIIESAAFGAESPNGNTVSLEDQLVRAADVKAQHDLALGIYTQSIDILRSGMGRIR
ncbi:MAG: flagellar biosynthesis protein FlgB [Rhodobacteraceae bacterium]|nr:MAG: flagellar biosynthesis protein FlgB [Paracoccaceae bacterium]